MYVVTLARKPLAEPTVAANVAAHGAGALAIHASRVGGRWPANLILGSTEAVADLDEQSGHTKSVTRKPTGRPIYPTDGPSMRWNANSVLDKTERGFADEGGASRFFKQVEP